jgi:tRNA-dihydrouridine synthase
MCVARYWLNAATRRENLFLFDPSDRPLLLQLTDSTPEPIVAMATHALFRGHIDALDINLGCPQSVAHKGVFGAFLVELNGVDFTVDLVRSVVAGVRPLPVTAKIRMHKDLATTTEYVRRLFDEAGVVAVTIHGRFLWQRGSRRGDSDWAAIDAIKAAMPHRCIIGNGDVRSHAQLQMRLRTSKADAVMVGYGALRDPTLFGPEVVPLQRVVQEYIDLARRIPNKLIDVKRHLGWLTKHVCKTKLQRFQLFDAQTLDAVVAVLATFDTPLHIQLPPAAERTADKIVDDVHLHEEPSTDMKPRRRKLVLKAMRRAAKRRSRNLEKAIEADALAAASGDGGKRKKARGEDRPKTDNNDDDGDDGDDDDDDGSGDDSARSDEGQG